MGVPAYYRSRQGRMFRIQRASERLDDEGARYVLRAFAVRLDPPSIPIAPAAEAACELSASALRDKLKLHHVVRTPEHTYEALWENLRLNLDGL